MRIDKTLLEPMVKSSIRIDYALDSEKEVPVGSSKVGGRPDLPTNFSWFYYGGKSFDGGTENRPLAFLAQINCEEASQHDKESLLPQNGILYFFYEMATMTWGFDPQDKGSARVYYFPGDISELNRTDFPSDLADEYIIPEMPMTFSSKDELPDFEEFIEWHDRFGGKKKFWNQYDAEKSKIVEMLEDDDEAVSKLLGYANLIQNGMLLDCELTTSGTNTGGPKGYTNVTTQQKANCTKWQLLFQLDSIQADGYEMLWGDGGRLYFYINTDDLTQLNFDNCWLILQCY